MMNSAPTSQCLDTLTFDNRFIRELPGDPDSSNTRRQVMAACYSRVSSTGVTQPKLAAFSREMAEQLGIESDACKSNLFAEVFAGNRLLEGMDPYAMCYGGHQFGSWAGQLGDGRAINLGEVVDRQGAHWTLQLKGSGLTPYSRSADGRAVLRSSVREFLCSEAMFHLDVPTTRALSLVLTGEAVIRDMFYDGHPKAEPGAVVCRVAPSFIRFGNFELPASHGNVHLLRLLADFTIRYHFPHLSAPSTETYIRWFNEVCRRTGEMIVHWMRVGFVHGVMNTDNMSILGLTIDYGPYGWLEDYDPIWTPNTTDAAGRRYCFGNQPQIAAWNLVQLANTIYPLIEDAKPLEEVLSNYSKHYEESWRSMMAQKLGLSAYCPVPDKELIDDLLDVLRLTETDMAIFFRRLAQIDVTTQTADPREDDLLIAPLLDAYYSPDDLTVDTRRRVAAWLRRYVARVQTDGTAPEHRRDRMNAVNPKYVLRNYLAQLAIDKAEQGDFSLVNELLEVLRRPYDEQPDYEQYAVKRPDWARHRPGCSMLSCSS